MAVMLRELALFPNLPALRHGEEWQEAIPRLERQMKELVQRQSVRYARHSRPSMLPLTSLSPYISDANARAQIINKSLVTKEDDPLEPLHSVVDGTVIPHFPRTIQEINQLGGMSYSVW
jgi:hypothetical protein